MLKSDVNFGKPVIIGHFLCLHRCGRSECEFFRKSLRESCSRNHVEQLCWPDQDTDLKKNKVPEVGKTVLRKSQFLTSPVSEGRRHGYGQRGKLRKLSGYRIPFQPDFDHSPNSHTIHPPNPHFSLFIDRYWSIIQNFEILSDQECAPQNSLP